MRRHSKRELPRTALRYVLEALIPYTQANLKLAFRPSMFFWDLEQISNTKARSLQNAYYRAQKQGFITISEDRQPRLTPKGRSAIQPYTPIKLKNALLMVIFDIPETERRKRQQLRLVLRELHFSQVQKSVWQSPYDHRHYLKQEVNRLKLQTNVLIYEAVKL